MVEQGLAGLLIGFVVGAMVMGALIAAFTLPDGLVVYIRRIVDAQLLAHGIGEAERDSDFPLPPPVPARPHPAPFPVLCDRCDQLRRNAERATMIALDPYYQAEGEDR